MPYDRERHGPHRIVGPGFHARVWAVVRRVPAGAVASYGDIAVRLGSRNVARHVGYALAALPEGSDVPWWRIVDSTGRLARAGTSAATRQARLLRAEGVGIVRGRVADFAMRRAAAVAATAVAAADE